MVFNPTSKLETISLLILFNIGELECVKKIISGWFTEHLSWKPYVNKLRKELSRSIVCIHRILRLVHLWLKKAYIIPLSTQRYLMEF